MRDAFHDIRDAARGLMHNGRALMLFFVTYVALLATLTMFIMTREATIKDLFVTLVTMIAVPALFFLLQAMSINYLETSGPRAFLMESLAIIRKLAIVSVPFIVIGLATYVILDKLDAFFSPPLHVQNLKSLSGEGETWSRVIFSTIRLVLFGIVLPLTSIHIWIAARQLDVRNVLKSIRSILLGAFALRSLKTYVLGFGIFAILPYTLIVVRTPSNRAWLEITFLSARLLLAFSLMLVGWMITVGALQRGVVAARMTDE